MGKKKAETDPTVTKPRRVQLSDPENPDWNELSSKLWAVRDGHDRFRGSYQYINHQPEEARLSQEGWDQIKKIIVEKGITVSVHNSCFGFSCAMSLWKPREEPYPGASIPAEEIFTVCSHMLPGDDRAGFARGWAEFSPLFTSPENIERLKWSELELPKDASAYDY